jgi:hypothetical protein
MNYIISSTDILANLKLLFYRPKQDELYFSEEPSPMLNQSRRIFDYTLVSHYLNQTILILFNLD